MAVGRAYDFSFHACDFILPSSFWQAFFAPKEHPKIARSFNCGSTPPKNKAPPGRQTKPLRKILPPLRGLRIFIASNPQFQLRAILIRRPATAPQIPQKKSAAHPRALKGLLTAAVAVVARGR